jgi:hypothetical protein
MHHILELVIYLVDGTFHRFKQDDPKAIEAIKEQLNPSRLFTQKQLLIAGSFFTMGVATESITRIDLVTASHAPLRHGAGVSHISEISERELDLYSKPRFYDTRRSQLVVHMGEPTEAIAEVQLADGQRIGLKIIHQMEAAAERRNLMQLFTGGMAIAVHRLGGGVLFLNPDQVIRWALYPGFPDAPTTALPLHRAEIFGDEAPSMIVKKLNDMTDLG